MKLYRFLYHTPNFSLEGLALEYAWSLSYWSWLHTPSNQFLTMLREYFGTGAA